MNVWAVIVTLNPEVARLRASCDALSASGAAVVLVDNSDDVAALDSSRFQDCEVVRNARNVGIARAQNVGIDRAAASGAQVIVFFDQDSRIDAGFLGRLLEPLRPGTPDVVVPVMIDEARGFEYPSFRVSRHGLLTKVYGRGRTDPYEVDVVTSSGTAATIETFARAGMMAEDLFIDGVDTEWSLRCRRAGVPIRVVPTAVMRHSVGSRSVRAGSATVLVHSPARCYYQIRNGIRLFAKDSVPFLFALRETLVLWAHKIALLFAVPNPSAYVRAYARGLYDGLTGVTGPMPRSGAR